MFSKTNPARVTWRKQCLVNWFPEYWFFLLVLVKGSVIMSETQQATSEPMEGFKGLSEISSHFSLQLYKEYIAKEKGNVFFSPFSILTCLAMTSAGARNQTAQQMRQAMKLDLIGEDPNVYRAFQKLLNHLNKSSRRGLVLTTANRMYVQDKTTVLEEFQNVLQNHFSSSAELVDFVSETEKVRQEINKWVEEQTNNKIKDLLVSGSLNSLTILVLVNAVYFKGDWDKKFNSSHTQPGVFRSTANDQRVVDMMFQKSKFPYGENPELRCQVLELPYLGKQLSMFIILPTEVDGLKSLEMQLTPDLFNNLIADMYPTETNVYLPRFKLECSAELSTLLAAMGMNDLFDSGSADLSGISDTNSLFVSAVLHKAFLEVNEEGSEAAAATGAIMMCRSLPIVTEFKVDRPCLLLIREKVSGIILFLGRLTTPPVSSSARDEL